MSDPDLARIRDAEWIEKLPADKQPGWLKLWSNVGDLRDQAIPTVVPLTESGDSQ